MKVVRISIFSLLRAALLLSIQHVIVFRTKLEVRVFEETSNLAQLQLGLSDRVVLVVDQGTGWSGPIRYGH